MIDFAQIGLPINLALFAVACVAVWFAGVRLTHYADAISHATGLGQAVIGIVLLAGVTSLPEIGVTATASIAGNAELAVNNLFGSIALQVALLAIVDLVIGKDALTSVVPDPAVMLEGSLNVILITFAAGAMVVGDVGFFGVGLWAWGCLFAYVASVWLLTNSRGQGGWLAARAGQVDKQLISEQRERESSASDTVQDPLPVLLAKTAAVAVIILVAGFVLAKTGDAIARQSGLGQSFVGFVLVAFATSLPELSTALTAARRGLYTMAISDILGTNIINVALIFVVDVLDSGDPVLNRMGDFAVFGALLSVLLTGLFMAGLSERRDKSILRMGYDSIAVILFYAVGVAALYTLRPDT